MFLGWLLPAMLNNIMLCFTALLPPDTLTALKKTRHCATLGFSRWFQQMAGEALVEVGVRLAKDELGDVELRAELGCSPGGSSLTQWRAANSLPALCLHQPLALYLTQTVDGSPSANYMHVSNQLLHAINNCARLWFAGFMPRDRQRKANGFEVYPFPVSHKETKGYDATGTKLWSVDNRCARCYKLAERDGYMGWYHPNNPSHKGNTWVRKMPDGSNVPHTTWGCNICKVYLCRKCLRMEDEDGNPHPDCWDHRAPTRGLMARRMTVDI